MEILLKIGRDDTNNLCQASKRFKKLKENGPQYQVATRELFTMAIDFIMTNKEMKMDEYSDWIDLFHVVVPVSYCDIVLVDKRWKTFIEQTGLFYPNIAMIFDKKSLESFFNTIEAWKDTMTIYC